MNYDAHVQYITVLASSGAHAEKIRHARERFASHFPLTEGANSITITLGGRIRILLPALPLSRLELWLAWIQDEMCVEPMDRAYIEGLFEKAVVDYLSK